MSLYKILWHELFGRTSFERIPEPELVMNGKETVQDFSRSGMIGGGLFGPYLYHGAQIGRRLKPGDRVIDMGSGSGQLLNMIARWFPHTRFIGTDLSTDMLAWAEAERTRLNLGNLHYENCDFSSLANFDDHSFDVVISSLALHHLPDETCLHKTLSNAQRVLKPGGSLYITDFGRVSSVKTVDALTAMVRATEDTLVATDYRNSLLAAFTHNDFQKEIDRLCIRGLQCYRSALIPLVIVLATPARHALPAEVSCEISACRRAMPSGRKRELRQLELLLGAGGLRSSI